MQALIELLAGFIALLAAAALSQFGVDMSSGARPDREVHRVSECHEAVSTQVLANKAADDC